MTDLDHSLQFELYKVQRFIKRWGQTFTFTLAGENSFNEPEGMKVEVSLPGVFHDNNEYITQSSSDAATIRSKLNTRILCLAKDAAQIQPEMTVVIQGQVYRVTGVRNIENLNLACDISLEVVLK